MMKNKDEFVKDVVKYLSCWLRTMDGEYSPVDTSKVKDVLKDIAASSATPIADFKRAVNEKRVSFPIFCIGLMEWYKKEKYDKCIAYIEEFEKKYNIEDERD